MASEIKNKMSKKAKEAIAKELRAAYNSAIWYGHAQYKGEKKTASQLFHIAAEHDITLIYSCPR